MEYTTQVLPDSSPKVSEGPSNAELKALLAEARNTREVLMDFNTAIGNGTYQGHQMLAVAKGCAFLQAILGQNAAHIKSIQDKLEAK